MRAQCRAASDEAAAVRRCAAEAGRIGARVLEPAVWLRLALPNLRAGQQVVGHLFALAALVNGTRGDRLLSTSTCTESSANVSESGGATSDKAQTTPAQILDALSSEEVLLSQQAPQQEQLLAVVDALLVSLADRADLFSFEVFRRAFCSH